MLFKRHWLPLNYSIHFKILLLVYKCLNGLAPTYLSELLRYTNGPRLLRSSSKNFLAVPKCLNGLAPTYLSELLRYTNGPRLLRSSSKNFLAVPRSRLKTYGDRAFSVAAPRLWNQLLPELRGVTSVDQFRTQLKTYLFKLAYDV